MATYTTLSQHDIDTVLAQYPIRIRSAAPLPGGAANSSYLLTTDSIAYVLTVLDNHDQASAQRLVTLLEYLVRNRIPTSRPLRTRGQAALAVFHQRPILVKEYVAGWCGVPLPDSHCHAAGELLAQVHAVPAPAWLAANGRRLPVDWTAWIDKFADSGFVAWLREQWALARAVEGLDGPSGLVHGDYFADNLVVREDGRLTVLDWETATRELFVLDLGMAIVGLCRVDGWFLPGRAAELLRGYESGRRLAPPERRLLPAAVRYASLLIAYHRYLRHHVTHPDPTKHHLYREIPRFVRSLDQHWPAGVPG